MLLFGENAFIVDGISVFPDHANASQFWYLPGPVRLSTQGDDDEPVFTLIKFKPAAVDAGVKGGGFLMFQVDLKMDDQTLAKIQGQASQFASGAVNLSPAFFEEGTVQCVAMNLQGGAGTVATQPNEGTFNVVEDILGASTPELQGDNVAIFSLTLSQEGAIIIEQAILQGATPVGVIYNMKFSGMRPALKVRITADYKRIYSEFSVGLSAQVYFFKAGIDAAFEKLKADGAIKVEVLSFTDDADLAKKEQWALDFFKDKLLTEWFTPSLNPGTPPAPTGPTGPTPPTGTGPTPPPNPTGTGPTPPPNPTGTGPTSPPHPPVPPTGTPPHPPVPPPNPPNPPVTPTGTPPVPQRLDTTAIPATAGATGQVSGTPGAGGAGHPQVPAPTGTGGPAPGGLSTAVVSFKLSYVSQDEQKTLTFEYDASEATRRTYSPQGFFEFLTEGLDPAKHIVEVDLDDPFFRVFEVDVSAPIDFGRIGLTAADVSLDYGDPADPATLKHADYVFEAGGANKEQFEVFLNADHDLSYRYGVQYHFDPTAGWLGANDTVETPVTVTEDRTLLLNPYEHLGFLEIMVLPARLDASLITSTDVNLSYTGPDGWTQSSVLNVTPGGLTQMWRLRLQDKTARSFTYSFVHHLNDGTTRTTDPVTTEASAVPVDDPFPDALDLEFIPLMTPGTIREVFIDVTYDDEVNDYHRKERITMMGDATQDTKMRIALLDPTNRTWTYQFTFVGTDNQLSREAPVTGTAEEVGVVPTPLPL